MNDQNRERFEKAICRWAGLIDEPPYPRNSDGTYCDPELEMAWQAWQARVPEGYTVVPVEPTDKMLYRNGFQTLTRETYQAMLEAAPEPGE